MPSWTRDAPSNRRIVVIPRRGPSGSRRGRVWEVLLWLARMRAFSEPGVVSSFVECLLGACVHTVLAAGRPLGFPSRVMSHAVVVGLHG